MHDFELNRDEASDAQRRVRGWLRDDERNIVAGWFPGCDDGAYFLGTGES